MVKKGGGKSWSQGSVGSNCISTTCQLCGSGQDSRQQSTDQGDSGWEPNMVPQAWAPTVVSGTGQCETVKTSARTGALS